ncbi:hypothetical protein P153DRAFT_224720 [Dothidotthia symphoricarpi CBS 119687]|uniref:Uncharacterized protein n=1 Tax=Dothidotthia symphoricarpi CBS 119687 TaxID=1392245 RepID=A0A6A6AFC1_9PLEO|nr:uncharacterized protein P153DRAFT_224720 [Dothidotthia symphoricarpi CBS 119687]KAF2129815.1 hypothetical protein P153DRAFT_224720 [Dothidotthia symphoricarpi CBS 119687]
MVGESRSVTYQSLTWSIVAFTRERRNTAGLSTNRSAECIRSQVRVWVTLFVPCATTLAMLVLAFAYTCVPSWLSSNALVTLPQRNRSSDRHPTMGELVRKESEKYCATRSRNCSASRAWNLLNKMRSTTLKTCVTYREVALQRRSRTFLEPFKARS